MILEDTCGEADAIVARRREVFPDEGFEDGSKRIENGVCGVLDSVKDQVKKALDLINDCNRWLDKAIASG